MRKRSTSCTPTLRADRNRALLHRGAPPRPRIVRRRRAAPPGTLLALAASALILGGCGSGTPSASGRGAVSPANHSAVASTEPQELPAIGGVQDVWAFSFGLDATRGEIEAALGKPTSVEDSEEIASGSAQVIQWYYPELELTFLIDESVRHEYLLSVLVNGGDVPLRGGLEIGMKLSDAVALLGEPRVTNGANRVWFYRDTTIELFTDGSLVTGIQLARALP